MLVELDGVRLSYSEAGDASEKVLVLVHGFPFNSAMWAPQLETPPAGWRVIAPDLRGFGASRPISGTITMATYAQDLAALLRHLGVQRAVLCGLSMGGYVLFAFLRQFGRMARGIILCDTRASADDEDARNGRRQLAARVRQEGVGAAVETMLPKLLTRTSRGTAVEEHVRRMMESAEPEAVIAALGAMMNRPDSTPLLRSLSVLPTQVIVGADDALAPAGEARLMARAIPSAFIEVIPDAGHLPNLEQPRAFDTVLNRFLTGLP